MCPGDYNRNTVCKHIFTGPACRTVFTVLDLDLLTSPWGQFLFLPLFSCWIAGNPRSLLFRKVWFTNVCFMVLFTSFPPPLFDLSGFSYDLRYLDNSKFLINVIFFYNTMLMMLTHNYPQKWDKLFTNGEKIDQSFFQFCLCFLGGGGGRSCVCMCRRAQKAYNGGPNFHSQCLHMVPSRALCTCPFSMTPWLGSQKLQEWYPSIEVSL